MQMSITRALSELKLLDKKIEKATINALFVATAVGKKPVKGFESVVEFEGTAKSQYQSLEDLIKRRQTIKSEIVKSNANTLVVIGGVEMTVAEAIERKTSIKYEEKLLFIMKRQFEATVDKAESENNRVKDRLDQLLEAQFGKDSKTKNEETEAISKQFFETNEVKVIDPLKLRVKIEELEEKIDNFHSEVDHVLSDSNTLTKIEIPA